MYDLLGAGEALFDPKLGDELAEMFENLLPLYDYFGGADSKRSVKIGDSPGKTKFSDIYDLLEASFPHSGSGAGSPGGPSLTKPPTGSTDCGRGKSCWPCAPCGNCRAGGIWSIWPWRRRPERRPGGPVSGRPDGGPALRAGSGAAGNGPGPAAHRLYRRHGFAWNDYAYMQPALRPTESPIPLRLMTRSAPLSAGGIPPAEKRNL